MYRIQDKYRIQSRWSTGELKNHLSRISDWAIAVNVWQRYKYSARFANPLQYLIAYPAKFANTLQYLIPYPGKFANPLQCFLGCSTKFANTLQYLINCSGKFAKSLQYPIPSTQSPVPNPQYRDQQSSVTDFLVEETSLPPPLSDFHDLSSASRVFQLPKKSWVAARYLVLVN